MESITVLPPMTTFSDTLNPERKASTCPHREAREKSKKKGRKERKRARNAHLPEVAMLPLCMGITLGATEWLTEFNQRGHTCLIDASIYVAICKVMHDKGKVMGQQQVGFQHSWETCTPKQPDLWWKTGRFNSQSWAGTSGWSDHSSTKMP